MELWELFQFRQASESSFIDVGESYGVTHFDRRPNQAKKML